MDYSSAYDVRNVLILKADRLCAESLHQLTQKAFPDASIKVAASVGRATTLLATESVDLLLCGTEASRDGDMLDFLSTCVTDHFRVRRIFVVSTNCENRIVAALRMLPIQGVFDCANDAPDQLAVALRTIAAGTRYWSPSVQERVQRHHLPPSSIFRLLTVFEQLVLSVVGDGSDDEAAARELGLSPATISTVRRKLHRKLGVQHRGELVRVAAQNGFVRFTPSGVSRPGFSMLAAAHNARKAKRIGFPGT